MASTGIFESHVQHPQQLQQPQPLPQEQLQQFAAIQQHQHRSILPRPSPVTNGEHTDGRSGTIAKRQQVLVACAACQKRKSKCTGQRPRCSLCELKDTECVYDTRAGEARGAHLKRKVTELTQELQYLRDLINTLRTAPYDEAQGLLQRIQSTSELEEACKLIRDSSLLLSVRKRSMETSHSIDVQTSTSPPSPTPPISRKRKESSAESVPQPRKDPRMSIEQITCNDVDTSDEAYRRKAILYSQSVLAHKVNDALTPRGAELRNWGSVVSDETE